MLKFYFSNSEVNCKVFSLFNKRITKPKKLHGLSLLCEGYTFEHMQWKQHILVIIYLFKAKTYED